MKKQKRKTKKQQQEMMRRGIIALSVGLFTVLTFLGEFGVIGKLGELLVFWVTYCAGLARYPLYICLLYLAYCIYKDRPLVERAIKVVGISLVTIGVVVLLTVPPYHDMQTIGQALASFHGHFNDANMLFAGGGIIGALLYGPLREFTGLVGTVIISSMTLLIGVACALEKTIQDMLDPSAELMKVGIGRMRERHEVKKKNKRQVIVDATTEQGTIGRKFTDYFPDNERTTAGEANGDKADVRNVQTMRYDAGDFSELASFDLEPEDVDVVEDVEPENSFDWSPELKNATPYKLPSLNLLHVPEATSEGNDAIDLNGQAEILAQTLENFKIKASVSAIQVGPAVTQYELSLAPGVKVNRIVNLATDIALALAVKDVRIEAPIPGKSAVGIEVPNASVRMVGLYEVLRKGYQNKDKKLLVGLGRTINGAEVQIEINKMPHLLVAGATGSGKSVCVNAIILSILLRATPDEVKFLMIDPKKVELNVYNNIPHLLAPVVTNPKAAAGALRKVVTMMEERYETFADAFVRNLEGYNEYARKKGIAELPYIVVIIDELSDLMVVAAKEVEESIMRLAQMARAAGIHLIVATQRPSVDVITGVIKSNIPSRIAFAVSSQVDSRTILDGAGAEKLVGRGDMLYLSAGENKPLRVQGAYISEEEIEKIVDFVKEQQESNYDSALTAVATAPIEEETDTLFSTPTNGRDDPLFAEAVDFAITAQSLSASKLQRRFPIGFNRAARILDSLVEAGVLGPDEGGNKGRRVLISHPSELERIEENGRHEVGDKEV